MPTQSNDRSWNCKFISLKVPVIRLGNMRCCVCVCIEQGWGRLGPSVVEFKIFLQQEVRIFL